MQPKRSGFLLDVVRPEWTLQYLLVFPEKQKKIENSVYPLKNPTIWVKHDLMGDFFFLERKPLPHVSTPFKAMIWAWIWNWSILTKDIFQLMKNAHHNENLILNSQNWELFSSPSIRRSMRHVLKKTITRKIVALQCYGIFCRLVEYFLLAYYLVGCFPNLWKSFRYEVLTCMV